MEPRGTIPGVPGCGPRVAAGSGTAAELVYHLAGALGTELKELARRFGPEAAARLVPLVVRALELLEKARATAEAGAPGTPEDPVSARRSIRRPSKVGQCSFSREELEQILQERNELKANVFPLKEELAYFQRELLTDHRVPGLLVEAMKVAVKKQRKKIKAKMLGIPEETESSDDEDSSWLLLSSDKGAHPPPTESRIQSFFGLSYRGETEAPEAQTSSMAPSKLGGEEETPQPPHLEPPCSALDEHLCLSC
uniref:Rab-interacting lysosomal protein n=1 Tax=Panthera tigris altaica TaxID=74533 RepID=A0A8C9KHT3_PANTA